jgi:hypothetical protein
MDKYYKDDNILQRTSKNSTLYDELYKEKQKPDNNVVFIDNVDEIDINKIKTIINNREDYKKVKNYEDVMGKELEDVESKKYEFEEIDDSKYDINQIIERKRETKTVDDENKIRKITEIQYEIMPEAETLEEENTFEDDQPNKTLESTDLFANLKETAKIDTTTVKETTFYTNTVSFEKDDFDEEKEQYEVKSGSSTFLKVLIVISFLIAIGVFVWFKYFN